MEKLCKFLIQNIYFLLSLLKRYWLKIFFNFSFVNELLVKKINCLFISFVYFKNWLSFQIYICFRLKMRLCIFQLIVHPVFQFIEWHIRLILLLNFLFIFNNFNIIISFFIVLFCVETFFCNLKNIVKTWFHLFLLPILNKILWKICCLHQTLISDYFFSFWF